MYTSDDTQAEIQNLWALIWQVKSSTAPSKTGLGTSYVFRPGGTPAPGVFVTSAALAAAMLLVDSAAFKVVTVDTALGAAHIETGVTLPDNVLFKGGGSSALPTLTFDEGSHLAGNTYQALDIVLVNAATATPVWSPSASTGSVLNLTGSELTPAGAGAVFCDAVGPVSVTAVESSVGDATHALFAVESTGAVDWLGFDGSTIFPNTIKQGSAPGGVVNFTVDGASQRGTSVVQVPVPTVTVLDPLTTFVWQPTGTDEGNVFTTSTGIATAAALTPGPKFLYLDDSASGFAGFNADAGTWDLSGFTIMPLDPSNTASHRTVNFPNGALFTFKTLYTQGNTLLQSSNTTAATAACVVTGTVLLQQHGGGFLTSGAGAKPVFDVTATGIVNAKFFQNAEIFTGTGPSVTGEAGGAFTVRVTGGIGSGTASVQSSTFAGAGAYTVHASAETLVSYTQAGVTGTFTVVWDPIVNTAVGTGNTGTTTGTVSAVTTNIARQQSGKVAVSGIVSGTASGAGTMTASLLRDATPIGTGVPFVTTATSLAFAMSVQFIDTLPDNANHTYTVQVAASAGTIATAANGCQVQAIEL